MGEQGSMGNRVIVKLLKGVSGFTGSQVQLEERRSGERVPGRAVGISVTEKAKSLSNRQRLIRAICAGK